MSCAAPVSAGLERSLIAALTSADLQRKDDLLPVPSPCPHSLLHPAFTAVCPGRLTADGRQGEGLEPSTPEGVTMAGLVRMSLDSPEETRPFVGGTGQLQLVNMTEGGVGRATFLPGWKWSEHVKPIAQTASCQADHRAYFMSG